MGKDSFRLTRGPKSDLNLDLYELGYVTDEEQLYIGTPTGEIPVGSNTLDQSRLKKLSQDVNRVDSNLSSLSELVGDDSKGLVKEVLSISSKSVAPGSYIIDLDKWGITEGFIDHKAPYSSNEWKLALSNTNGIHNAIKWAYDNNYTNVVLPRGEYNICYRTTRDYYRAYYDSILIPSNTVFDLNGSKLKVIFDSKKWNPLVPKPSNMPPNSKDYQVSGIAVAFVNSQTSSIENGELIGDIYERDFDDTESTWESEKGCEQTYGVLVTESSSRNSIKNMIIRGFMGDSISGSLLVSPEYGSLNGGYNPEFTPGDVDSTGNLVESSTSYRTAKIVLENVTSPYLTTITGIGYSRFPSFDKLKIVWYDESDRYISSEYVRYLDRFKIPKTAKKFISVIEHESSGQSSLRKQFQFVTKVSEFLTIDNCDLYDSHRGGISGGVFDTVIQGTRIYDCGLGEKDGFPVFPDTTRYLINFEDNICNSVIISKCNLSSSFNGVLLAAKDIKINGNIIDRCLGVTIYGNETTTITSNTLSEVSFMKSSRRRTITVTSNTIGQLRTDNIESDTVLITNNNISQSGPIPISPTVRCMNNNMYYDCSNNKYTEVGFLYGGGNSSTILNNSDTLVDIIKDMTDSYNSRDTISMIGSSPGKIRSRAVDVMNLAIVNSFIEFIRYSTNKPMIKVNNLSINLSEGSSVCPLRINAYSRFTESSTYHLVFNNLQVINKLSVSSYGALFDYRTWNNTPNHSFKLEINDSEVELTDKYSGSELFHIEVGGSGCESDRYSIIVRNTVFRNTSSSTAKIINKTYLQSTSSQFTISFIDCRFEGSWNFEDYNSSNVTIERLSSSNIIESKDGSMYTLSVDNKGVISTAPVLLK